MSSSSTNIHRQVFNTNNTQLAAIFSSQKEAEEAVSALMTDTAVDSEQITVLEPGESVLSQKIEADSRNIGRRMLASHLLMGGVGLVVGLLIASILVSNGPLLTQQNPLFTFIALISPGIFIGMFVAGLFSLRPDRTELQETVRHALRQKRIALVVNLSNAHSVDRVRAVLARQSATVVEAIR